LTGQVASLESLVESLSECPEVIVSEPFNSSPYIQAAGAFVSLIVFTLVVIFYKGGPDDRSDDSSGGGSIDSSSSPSVCELPSPPGQATSELGSPLAPSEFEFDPTHSIEEFVSNSSPEESLIWSSNAVKQASEIVEVAAAITVAEPATADALQVSLFVIGSN